MSSSLAPQTEEMLRAMRAQELRVFVDAFGQLAREARGRAPAELTAAIGDLAAGFAGAAGPYCMIALAAGILVELGGSPMAMREVLPGRTLAAMNLARAFPGAWHRASGGRPLPASDDLATLPDAVELIGAAAREQERDPATAQAIALAWFDVDHWAGCLRMAMQDREFRAALAEEERDRIRDAARAIGGAFREAGFLEKVAMVLDDEPLIVLDPASERGFRLTISGIGNNEQLYTMLAGILSGLGLPGVEPPLPEWLSAATTGPNTYFRLPERIYRRMRLFDGQGKHVAPGLLPAHIGLLDETRVVVVHPADDYSWGGGRPFDTMVPGLVLDGELSHDQAAAWLARTAPAIEDDYSLTKYKTRRRKK